MLLVIFTMSHSKSPLHSNRAQFEVRLGMADKPAGILTGNSSGASELEVDIEYLSDDTCHALIALLCSPRDSSWFTKSHVCGEFG